MAKLTPCSSERPTKGMEIVNGYHRYRVALDLGWKEIEIKNLGKIADSKAKAIALATEDAKLPLDQIEVAKLVRDMLAFDPQSFDDMPYNAEDTEGMQKLLSFDWDGFKEDLKEEEPHDDSEGYKIILPSDRLTAWRDLKTIKGAESDTELLVMLIDEQGLTYEKDHDKSKEEAAPNSRDQKARGQGKK